MNIQRPVSLEAAPSVHWLGSGGVVMVGTLTVAFLSPGDSEVGLKKIEELCSKGVYMGADLLLTPEWPAGLASTLPPNGPHTYVHVPIYQYMSQHTHSHYLYSCTLLHAVIFTVSLVLWRVSEFILTE